MAWAVVKDSSCYMLLKKCIKENKVMAYELIKSARLNDGLTDVQKKYLRTTYAN